MARHVYSNGTDSYVANDAAHAVELAKAYLASLDCDPTPRDLDLRQVPDDKVIRIHEEIVQPEPGEGEDWPNEHKATERTAAEWAEQPAGFLCTTDY